MTEPLGQQLRTLLAERGWTQSDLVRASGVDKNTLSGLINGKSQPRDATLGKIEAALGLTPGTLAGLGEDQPLPGDEADGAAELSAASDSELTSELTYRIESLRRQVAELTRQIQGSVEVIERERRRAGLRREFIESIDENSPDDLRDAKEAWAVLMHDRSGLGVGWKPDDAHAYEALCDTFDALAWAEDQGLVVVERISYPDEDRNYGPPVGDYLGLGSWEPHPRGIVALPVRGFAPDPNSGTLVEFAQLDGVPELTRRDDVTLAARRVPGYGKIKQARDAEKRVGEDNQDDGGMEPA